MSNTPLANALQWSQAPEEPKLSKSTPIQRGDAKEMDTPNHSGSDETSIESSSQGPATELNIIARRDLGMFLGDPANIHLIYRHFTLLIQLIAQALALPAPVWARAVTLFRKLYLQTTFSTSDPRITAPILLLVAAKSFQHLRFSTTDIVGVLKSLEPRHNWPFKYEDLLIEEFHVLHHLNFEVDFPLAYDILAHLLEPIAIQVGSGRAGSMALPAAPASSSSVSLQSTTHDDRIAIAIESAESSPLGPDWCFGLMTNLSAAELEEFCQRAFSALNDIYLRTWMPLTYPPSYLALAAIRTALHIPKESEFRTASAAFRDAIRGCGSKHAREWEQAVIRISNHLIEILSLERSIDDGVDGYLPGVDANGRVLLEGSNSLSSVSDLGRGSQTCLTSKLHLLTDSQLESLMQLYHGQVVRSLASMNPGSPPAKHISWTVANQIFTNPTNPTEASAGNTGGSALVGGIVLTLGDVHRILNVLAKQKYERQLSRD